MVVPKGFKRDFELVAKDYQLDKSEYDKFKDVVRRMLTDNFDFTVKWIHDSAVGLYDPERRQGITPYTGGTPPLEKK